VRLWVLVLLFAPGCDGRDEHALRVGSKKFTESVILGEVVAQNFASKGWDVVHMSELGGTQILWKGLLSDELDAYVEYTGTLREEIFAGRDLPTDEDLRGALAELDLWASKPLGFNNTYAIGMREAHARELGIETISDLVAHTDLTLALGNECLERSDGWPGLRAAYGLPHKDVTGLDHDLAYKGMLSGAIDVMDLYSTDAEIEAYNLRALVDDREYFPEYEALIVYRGDIAFREAGAGDPLSGRAWSLDEAEMRQLNARVKLEGVSEARVAADFLATWGIDSEVVEKTRAERIFARTLEHLFLVLISLGAAILIALPLGVASFLQRRLGRVVLALVGVLQTVPSFAMFVFMIPLFGFGAKPTIAALFLYSLLPIVRGVHAGLAGVPRELRESAIALGLSRSARLLRIELPLATRSILAGIQTSAVINVGTATIGAIIGARGYGQPILAGIRRDDMALVMEGAIPAALLAVLVQLVFELVERRLLPRGLRLAEESV